MLQKLPRTFYITKTKANISSLSQKKKKKSVLVALMVTTTRRRDILINKARETSTLELQSPKKRQNRPR